jgi:hypothetical protein
LIYHRDVEKNHHCNNPTLNFGYLLVRAADYHWLTEHEVANKGALRTHEAREPSPARQDALAWGVSFSATDQNKALDDVASFIRALAPRRVKAMLRN